MPIVNQKQLDECMSEVSFSYDSPKVEAAIDDIAKEYAKNYKIPGNRPGKASIDAVKMAARKQVLEAAKQKLFQDAYQDILHENKWKPFSQPKVLESNITFGSFSAKFVVGYAPSIELKQHKGIELSLPNDMPNDQFIFDKFVENVCQTHGDTVPFGEDDFLLNGDNAIINFIGKLDGNDFPGNSGEGIQIEVGKGNTIQGFEDNIIGMKVGEKREFDMTFTDNAPTKEFNGKTVHFTVDLLSAARMVPAAFDEALAVKVGQETLDKLKENINQAVENYKKDMVFNALKSPAADKLIELNEIKIPQWMIIETAKMTAELQKFTMETLTVEEKEKLFKETEHNIKLSFILDKIKDTEMECVLSEQELLQILNNNIHKFPEDVKKELIEGKNIGLYMKIMNDIQIENVLKWVVDNSVKVINAELVKE